MSKLAIYLLQNVNASMIASYEQSEKRTQTVDCGCSDCDGGGELRALFASF